MILSTHENIKKHQKTTLASSTPAPGTAAAVLRCSAGTAMLTAASRCSSLPPLAHHSVLSGPAVDKWSSAKPLNNNRKKKITPSTTVALTTGYPKTSCSRFQYFLQVQHHERPTRLQEPQQLSSATAASFELGELRVRRRNRRQGRPRAAQAALRPRTAYTVVVYTQPVRSKHSKKRRSALNRTTHSRPSQQPAQASLV